MSPNSGLQPRRHFQSMVFVQGMFMSIRVIWACFFFTTSSTEKWVCLEDVLSFQGHWGFWSKCTMMELGFGCLFKARYVGFLDIWVEIPRLSRTDGQEKLSFTGTGLGQRGQAREEQNRGKGNTSLTAKGIQVTVWVRWHMLVIATPGRQKQEDQ